MPVQTQLLQRLQRQHSRFLDPPCQIHLLSTLLDLTRVHGDLCARCPSTLITRANSFVHPSTFSVPQSAQRLLLLLLTPTLQRLTQRGTWKTYCHTVNEFIRGGCPALPPLAHETLLSILIPTWVYMRNGQEGRSSRVSLHASRTHINPKMPRPADHRHPFIRTDEGESCVRHQTWPPSSFIQQLIHIIDQPASTRLLRGALLGCCESNPVSSRKMLTTRPAKSEISTSGLDCNKSKCRHTSQAKVCSYRDPSDDQSLPSHL